MKDADAKTSLFKTTGVVFISIGSLVFIAGLIWSLKTASFVMRASKTQGTVVEVERSRASKGGTMYYPIFTFTDASGIIHKQRTASGSSRYNFRPGQEVGILYDSDSPEKSEIDTFGTVWFFPLFITGFGLVFGGFAGFWLFAATKSLKLEREKDAVSRRSSGGGR